MTSPHSRASVQFSRLVVSDSLWPHEPHNARPPCTSPTPGVYSNSCPLSRWCHPTISSSVAPFFFCLHSFPASGSFPMSWVFPSGSQSIGASASVLPMNIQGWFSLRLNGLIFLLSKGLSRVFSSTTVLRRSAFFIVQLSHLYMTTGKAIALTIWTFVSKVIYLLFNTLSRSVIAFLPRSNQLLISWLSSPSAVIVGHKKRKSVTAFTFSPSTCNLVF